MSVPQSAPNRRSAMETSIGPLRRAAVARLERGGIESAAADARILLAEALGTAAAAVLAESNEAPAGLACRLEKLVLRRLAGEPVARIIGRKEFWSLGFALGRDTLVPRPETETLVEAALVAFPEREAELRVLDLGTGAGILLAAVLSERPCASGIGVDRSEAAVRMARANLTAFGLGGRAHFMVGDWGGALHEGFDLVLCNPPYVATHEFGALSLDVRDHDPHVALDGGMDGLAAYRVILPDLARLLAENGVAIFELGRGQESAVADLAHAAGLLVAGSARSDLGGIPRALTFRRRS
jgi:release factor glutamine methyltransferase